MTCKRWASIGPMARSTRATRCISALRGRLPLAEQDQTPAGADELRAEFEKPPFGWDGNCVKVALALLLRAAAAG